MSNRVAKIRILDEANIIVVGLHGDDVIRLHDKYAVPAPNYYFHPKFRLGQWDGKINYFHKTGKSYLYLLDEILPAIVRMGYEIKIDDLRTKHVVRPQPITADIFSNVIHSEIGEPIVLREYQVKLVNNLIEYGNGIGLASTGSGKTLMMAALVTAYNACGIKTLTIVPNQSLIKQTKTQYIECGLDTGEYSGTTKTLNHQNVVSTWQALQNNTKIVNGFDMVIVDECHSVSGKVLRNIVTDHAAGMPYRFGFTGTMPKDVATVLAVNVALGPVRYEVPAAELIERNVLSNLNINVLQLVEDFSQEYKQYCEEENIGEPPTETQFKDSYFPDFASEKKYLQSKPPRIEWIAECIKLRRDDKKGNVLCLVDNITFGRKLAEQIEGAIFVNGKDMKSVDERQRVYDMFADADDLVIIATVHIAGTGINIHRIFNLFLVDSGKSFIRVIQSIGRGLRKASDKDTVAVWDVCSDLKYSKRHLNERVKYYKEAQYPYKKSKLKYTE